jgi:perosamine synthetase
MNEMRNEISIAMPSDQDASGRQLGDEEIVAVTEAIRSGTLTSTKGTFVKRFQAAFAERLGVAYCYACSSGTNAIHAAVAAIDPEPGDEIVTSPITDMGAITPIIYQTAVPVFADVDSVSGNVTAESIARVIGPKTKAIIVIEDCAQAYGASYDGRSIGTLGAIGCFSLQQGKHITTGEGGMVVANDPDLARRLRLFIDKAWGYGDPKPDHYFVALNGRMTELQGAVALAQLGKLSHSVERRTTMAKRLHDALSGLEGVTVIDAPEKGEQSYWKFAVHVPAERGGPDALAAVLKGYDIASAPRYIQKPAFDCAVIRDRKTFGNSGFPFTLARPEVLDYAPEKYAGTRAFLKSVLVLPWNERFEERHVDQIACGIADFVSNHVE